MTEKEGFVCIFISKEMKINVSRDPARASNSPQDCCI